MKNGWPIKKLGDICEIERGGSPRPINSFLTTESAGINWIRIGDTKNVSKYISRTQEKIRPEGVKRSRMVYEGDFILSNSMSFGRPYIMKTSGCIHDGWLVLREREPKVNQDYLYYVLISDLVFRQFDRLAAGSTVRNLNINLVRRVEIPIPPISEQERIVGMLDEAFAGIATAKANAEKNLRNAHALFETHLNTIFAQRGEGWEEKTINEITSILGDGLHGTPKYSDDGEYLFINGNNLDDGKIVLKASTKRVSVVEYRKHKKLLTDRTVLVSINGTLGNVAFYNNEKIILGKSACYFNLIDGVNKHFIKYIISSPYFSEYAHREATGATIKNVSLKSMRAFKFLLPSLAEQDRIVCKLDILSSETQRLESIYQRKLNALDELKKSLLHQAFTGEL